MLVMVRQAAGALVSEADIQALETRVNQARAGAVMGAGGVPDNERLRIEACHRVLVAAEAELGRAKRRNRAEAMALYDEAVAAQSAALADAGMGSYDTFLAAITTRTPGAPPRTSWRPRALRSTRPAKFRMCPRASSSRSAKR